MSGAAIIAMLGGLYAGFLFGCGYASAVTRRRMFEEAQRRGQLS